jgi:hypothetical protein
VQAGLVKNATLTENGSSSSLPSVRPRVQNLILLLKKKKEEKEK